MKWPTGAPVIDGGPLRRGQLAELTGLEADRPVRVDHALRIPGRSRGECDQRGCVDVDGDGSLDRGSVQELLKRNGFRRQFPREGRPDNSPLSTQATQQLPIGREILGTTESVGGDDELGIGDADDVLELFCAIEMDDGDHNGAGVRSTPEGDRCFHPIRELKDDDVTRSDADVAEPTCKSSRGTIDVSDRAAPRSGRRVHSERGIGHGAEAPRHQVAEAVFRPPAFGDVTAFEDLGDLAPLPLLAWAAASCRHSGGLYRRPTDYRLRHQLLLRTGEQRPPLFGLYAAAGPQGGLAQPEPSQRIVEDPGERD